MTTLNPEQETALQHLAEADRDWRAGKASVKERSDALAKKLAVELMESEMREVTDRRAYLAHRARELGVPVSQIARKGLDTGDRTTAYGVIAAGALVTPPASVQTAPETPAPVVELHPEFRIEGDVVTVTPKEDELLSFLPLLGLEAADLARYPELRSAQFRAFEDHYEAVTPFWLDAADARHPVVALAGVGQPIGTRLRAFIQSQALATAA